MTRLATPTYTGNSLRLKSGTTWVRTHIEGTESYTLRVLDRSRGQHQGLEHVWKFRESKKIGISA